MSTDIDIEYLYIEEDSSLMVPISTLSQVSSSTSSDSQPKKKQRVDSSPDISANTSHPKVIGDISQTLSLFECCVCLDYITPPILQCRNSHLFCQTCRRKFKSPLKCPTCRVVLLQPDIRNHSLEQIADSLRLPFPCKYKTNGCDVTSLLTEKAKHEDWCEYEPFRCPEVLDECQWSGSREEVAQHLMDRHEYSIKESDNLKWRIKMDDEEDNRTVNDWRKLLDYKKQKFLYINKFDSDRKNHFKAIVLFIGEQRIADRFKYKIEVINTSDGTRLLWEDKPISIRSDIKSLLSFDNKNYGLNIDHSMIGRLSDNNMFKINLTME